MKKLLEEILKNIVDNPEDISIAEETFEDGTKRYLITANPEDTGKIIGKEGKVIKAIRNLAKVLAVKENIKVRIDIP